METVGILTGGGDAPGLNAVIRAAVKTAIQQYGCEVFGIRNGYDGFIEEKGVIPLGLGDVRGILPRGGAILGAANRGNPFARKVIREGKEVTIDVSDEIVKGIKRLQLDALLVLGGDGTLPIAHELHQKGVPVIGVPKTIDNDIGGTDITFGFDTAHVIARALLFLPETIPTTTRRLLTLRVRCCRGEHPPRNDVGAEYAQHHPAPTFVHHRASYRFADQRSARVCGSHCR